MVQNKSSDIEAVMDPNTHRPVSARSCLRHARRELAAADAASTVWRKAALLQTHDAWMVRYRLTLRLALNAPR